MKKILLVAASVTLLAAGCQKTEIVNPDPEPAMVFTTGMNKLTKAVGTSDASKDGMPNLQAQDFRVWAYANYEDPNTTDVEMNSIYDGMENLNIYYRETSTGEENSPVLGSWAPEKEYYWPGSNKNLFFFAVSGADYGNDLDKNQTAVSVNINEKTMAVNAFNVDPDSPNVDLMIADAVDQHQGDKAVDLKFHHALSKIEFLFKTVQSDNMRVLVQNIVVDDLVATGDLAVNLDNEKKVEAKDNQTTPDVVTSTTYPVVFTWTPTAETVTKSFTDDYAEDYTQWGWGEEGEEYHKIELEDGATSVDLSNTEDPGYSAFDRTAMVLTTEPTPFATWLMVPQDITGKKVTVTYIINKRQFKSVFALDTTELTKWEDNQYIRYTVTLAPNLISFVPSVDEWDNIDAAEQQN